MSIIRNFSFLIVFISFLLIPVKNFSQKSSSRKQIEVTLRMIGHQILLNAGDSTSRVLPITKHGDRYKVEFATEFQFNPEDLVATIDEVVQSSELKHGYIVEVEECLTNDVVYSYQMGGLDDPSIIPCQTRDQPNRCYRLMFTLFAVEKKRDIQESRNSESNQNSYLILLGVFVGLLVIFLFVKRNRKATRINPNMIALGKFHFDKHNAELILEEQRIDLTSKESDLLLLLHTTVNVTVEREIILNKVWGDEGDYVGRTLDVFISKLRKKLEADTNVKIVNVRGVGYKLILNSEG